LNNTNQVPAGKFKAECLKMMDEVSKSGHSIIVTKRGVPLVRLVPIEKDNGNQKKFGALKGSIQICGDIVSGVGESWEADQ